MIQENAAPQDGSTTYPPKPWGYTPADSPPPSSRRRGRVIVPAVAAVIALGFGVAIGAGNKPKPEVQTRTVTSIETHTVTVTPQACMDALTTAEQVFGKAGDGFGVVGDMMNTMTVGLSAAANLDTAGIDAATAELQAQTAKLQAMSNDVGDLRDRYEREATACRTS